jgi:hypothetical protein
LKGFSRKTFAPAAPPILLRLGLALKIIKGICLVRHILLNACKHPAHPRGSGTNPKYPQNFAKYTLFFFGRVGRFNGYMYDAKPIFIFKDGCRNIVNRIGFD